jgi:DNA-binding winged helix-turn-helix (wHTH) protein
VADGVSHAGEPGRPCSETLEIQPEILLKNAEALSHHVRCTISDLQTGLPLKGDFYLGAWLVEPSLGRVSVDGRTVQVRPKVMDLLVFLAGSRGNVISKETLLNEVWRTEAISESALTRTITELRSAVGDDAEHPRFLETIPKRGYRLIAPVRPVASADESISRRQRTPRLAIWIAIVLAAVSITLLVSVMAPAESVRVTPLTSLPGQEGQPAFSPDGKQVAVAWSGASDDNFDI